MTYFIVTVLLCAIALADTWAYCKAAHPERTSSRWYLFPLGGGWLALWRFGRDKQER